uniref:Tetratricopeptide repeat protein 21A/21B N-terminal ARM repeat domain-containing protein n=1 Tax=Chelonoidis abingdonii TaxID=106734 RepID=A0A8C0IYQ7_CHEAB
ISSNDNSIWDSSSDLKIFQPCKAICEFRLDKYINDPVFQFFKAYGTLHLGQIQDAILQLENARKCHSDVSLCCLLALIYAHKICENKCCCIHAKLTDKGNLPPTTHLTASPTTHLTACQAVLRIN